MAQLIEGQGTQHFSAAESVVVECARCGCRNRIPVDATKSYRCGNCKTPFVADGTIRNSRFPLQQSIPPKSAKTAFVLTLFAGPLGFFYVSRSFGVASVIVFAIALAIHLGLVVADLTWALPQLLIQRSVAPLLLWISWGMQNTILACFLSNTVKKRNAAMRTVDLDTIRIFQKFRDCLAPMCFIYGSLLVFPWVLSDLNVSVSALAQTEFLTAAVYFCVPTRWLLCSLRQ
jgi:hypothetical protein